MSRHVTVCRSCGQEIRLVMVIPTVLRAGTTRAYIPLDLVFDPDGGVPASHAMNLARTRCRPLTGEHPIEAHEVPALTHFATCPARLRPHRVPASTATEGSR